MARFIESCETARRGLILQLEHELRGLQNDRTKQRQVQEIENRLARLKTGQELVVPTLRFPVQVGDIGRLPGNECYVDQVVSPTELLVRCFFPVVVTTVRNFQRYRETTTQPVQCVLRGSGLPETGEGQEVDIASPWIVVGRETYETVSGSSKTILVLAPFDLESIKGRLDKARTEP